jgi:NAD(P)-dependent dehydrogenase (short-subunit alcohol dehydrogenase family)
VDCNVSDATAVERAIATAVEAFSRLDIAVVNAGINGV